jgi:3-dehydroquinate dehydratase I
MMDLHTAPPPKTIPLRDGGRIAGAGPVICAPLVGRSRASLGAEASSLAMQQPDLLEWRADHFEGGVPGAASDALVATAAVIRAAAPGRPLLVTLRAVREGGVDRGLDDATRAGLLGAVARAGLADIVDFEAGSDPVALAMLREICVVARVPLLLSMHDFERTPSSDSLLGAYSRMAALGADIVKLAVMPRSEADVTTLLEATWRADRALSMPLVGISMGALGTPSRVLGHRFGSRITWCSGVEASAPGQLPLELLRRLVEESRTP